MSGNDARGTATVAGFVASRLLPRDAEANCNLIPPAERSFPSTLGSTSSAAAAPGQVVTLRIGACAPPSTSFDPIAANNTVTLTFEPPTGASFNTTYVLPALPNGVCSNGCTNEGASCSGHGGCTGCANGCANTVDECAGGGWPPCQVLNFAMPDATTLEGLSPATGGVAGPARIVVTTPSATAAEIGPLYRSLNDKEIRKGLCPKNAHPFRQFTVLPRLNAYQNLVSGALRATVDGDNNLLVPFDYRGVYGGRGCCTGIGQLLDGQLGFDAFSSSPGTPIQIPSDDYLRTYTTDGIDLAPILKGAGSGRFLGTADGNEGILRIARTVGSCVGGTNGSRPCTQAADCPGGYCNAPADIFDVTDRLQGSKGPILLDQATTNIREDFAINDIKSSANALAVARASDRRVVITDTATGARTETGKSATKAGPKAAMETNGDVIAFLESEVGGDVNGDGDVFDTILRVYKGGTEVTSGMTIPADAGRLVNGESLQVANGRVFYRRLESADANQTTQRASLSNGGAQASLGVGYYGFAISADGNKVAFTSGDTGLVAGDTNGYWDIFVRDRLAQTTTRVNLAYNGAQATNGSGDPAISADGRYVAFYSAAGNLISDPDTNLAEDIFVRDTVAGTTERVSVDSNGYQADAQSLDPAISADGRFVAFKTTATNLDLVNGTDANGKSDVFVHDRCESNGVSVSGCSPATVRATVANDGSASDGLPPGNASYAMSGDGRFVVFTSADTDLVPGGTSGIHHLFARDLQKNTTTLISVASDGTQLSWGNSIWRNAVSHDGRFVVFTNGGHVLLRDRDADGNGIFDETELGRTATRTVSVATNGALANGPCGTASISADGRRVGFSSNANNLVTGDTNGTVDLFVHDTVTGTTMRANASPIGAESTTADPNILSQVAANGTHIAYTNSAGDLVGGDTNGAYDVFVAGYAPRTEPYVCGNSILESGEQCDPPGAFLCPGSQACSVTCQCNDLTQDGDLEDTLFQFLIATPSPPPPGTVGIMLDRTTAGWVRGDLAAFMNDAALFSVYNAATASATNYPVTTRRWTGSANLGATTVVEEGFTDFNLDGDTEDAVLGVLIPPSSGFIPGWPSRGYVANALGATDICDLGIYAGKSCTSDADCSPGGVCRGIVVFARPEADEDDAGPLCQPTEPAGGCDLNGDKDANDRVLHVYRQSTNSVTNLGQQAEEFVVKDNLVAFRTSEAAQGGTVLNGDGLADDYVMQVYDLSKLDGSGLINTGQAARLCYITGCDPNLPYKIKDDTISFLGSEVDQNKDLNGRDGIGQLVMLVFDVHSGPLQVFDLPDTPEDVPLFPEDFVGSGAVYAQTTEAALGYDANEDGDMDDVVVGVTGDADSDGVFDQFDTCTAVTDPEHQDSDLDGAGDECDSSPFCADLAPQAPPTAPNTSAATCQKAAGKAAAAYLKKRATASRICLDKIAKGDVVGDPTNMCLGRVVGGVDVPPLDPKTAASIAKAAAKLQATVAAKCSSGLGQLDSCGTNVNDEVGCLKGAYATAAISAGQRAYGSVQTIADPASRACQRKVGSAAVKYVTAVAKAMQGCLDRLNAGRLAGDARTLCLGTMTSGVVSPPADSATMNAMILAETKLRNAINLGCAAGQLWFLEACGTNTGSAGDCLVCTGWRHAVEAVRSGYGPN